MSIRALFVSVMLLGLSFGGGRAEAHAALVGSDPPDGAVLPQAPKELKLQFEEPVSPLVLRLIDPRGQADDLKTFEVREDTVVIRPPAHLERGTHVLSWRVISSDGHPVGGSVVFSIGASGGNARSAGTNDTDPAVRIAILIARVVLYAGLFVGVGSAVFTTWIAGERRLWGSARRINLAAIGWGLAAAWLSVGLQGLDAVGAPLASLSDRAVWNQGLHTAYGATVLASVAALLLAWFSLNTAMPSLARITSAAGLIGAGVALAASGHAASAQPQWLTRTGVFLHVTCLVFWLGALVPLFAMLRSEDPKSVAIMNRFSVAILPVVLVLVVTGAALAVVQVPSLDSLWTSAYGRILFFKLLLVLALLGLAALNRVVFTPALSRRQGRAVVKRRFAQSIAAEGMLVLAILSLVTGWRFTPPPRAVLAASARSQPAVVHIHSDQGTAEVTLNPGRAGPATAMITLVSRAGAPLDPQEVTLGLSNPTAGIEPLERKAKRVAQGIWRVDDVIIPVPGRWLVRVDVLVSDFESLTLEDAVMVRP